MPSVCHVDRDLIGEATRTASIPAKKAVNIKLIVHASTNVALVSSV
jgi:hypothetical protein